MTLRLVRNCNNISFRLHTADRMNARGESFKILLRTRKFQKNPDR